MQAYFQQYKFAGDYRLRRVFAESMQTAVAQQAADCVVVIPVTPATLTTRGFNQVSGWLADGTNPLCGLQTVARTKAVPQSKKTRAQRLLLTQPFALTRPAPRIYQQHVLLVDDIYTTGRTIRHAASLLLENGAKSVTGLTLAR
ncbi:ComF family protein [Lactiplantibacillus plajomi]|uniref:ComF family protein n=2 Tax=Lactiplantibacillus plajomi TaxID=1457217 RepID=A0ABV6K5E1_9LACO